MTWRRGGGALAVVALVRHHPSLCSGLLVRAGAGKQSTCSYRFCSSSSSSLCLSIVPEQARFTRDRYAPHAGYSTYFSVLTNARIQAHRVRQKSGSAHDSLCNKVRHTHTTTHPSEFIQLCLLKQAMCIEATVEGDTAQCTPHIHPLIKLAI
jgi:hypothetical protein